MKASGEITDCLSAGCGFRCCYRMGQSRKIGVAVFPSEVERVAKESPHLQVLDDDYHGGKLMLCTAQDTATCDGGYKPMDCQFYPLFPLPSKNGGPDTVLCDDGPGPMQCPLGLRAIRAHAARMWAKLTLNGADRDFARKVPAAPYRDITDELR